MLECIHNFSRGVGDMIRLESLQYLQEIAKCQSINKAADKLFLSKSALSTAIKNLESEFGVPLLNRTIHGVSLTPAGENVVEKANLVFNLIDGMKNDCWMYANNNSLGKINIYTESNFATSVLPTLLPDLIHISNAKISTHEASFDEIVNAVQADVSNIGFFLSICPLDETICQDIQYLLISTYDTYAVTAKYSKHVPPTVKELSQEELMDLPQVVITYNKSCNLHLGSLSSDDYFGYNIAFATDNNNIYYQAIANDIGIGQMCLFNAKFGLEERKNLRFIPIEDSQTMYLYILCNNDFDKELMVKYSNVVEMALDA